MLYLFPYWIDMAVLIFMVISGFVNAKSYHTKDITNFEEAYSFKNVGIRIIQYTIPFLFVYVIECIIFLIQKRNINYFFLFLQGAKGPGSYYYPIMIQFVFVFPVIYFIIHKYRFKGLLITFLCNIVFEVLQSAYGLNEETYRLIVLRYTFVISFGCYLNYIEEEDSIKKLLKDISFSLVLIGGVFIYVVSYMEYEPIILKYWTGTSCLAALYIIPIMGILIKKGTIHLGLFEILGKASYNIYLVQMVYYTAAPIIYTLITDRVIQLLVSVILPVIGGLIFKLVQTPITNKAIKWYLQWLEL